MELYAPWNCIQQVEWRWTRKYNSSTYDKANSVQLSVKRQSRPSVLWIQESSKPKRECLVSPDRACCIRGQLRFIHSWHRTMDYPWFLTADKAIFSGSFIIASLSLNLLLLENRAIKLLLTTGNGIRTETWQPWTLAKGRQPGSSGRLSVQQALERATS